MLVVYSSDFATSALLASPSQEKPFPSHSKYANYNEPYAYFLKTCEKNNLTVALTTSKDITKNGHFLSYWTFEKSKWVKMKSPCYSSLIFDKFSPVNLEQKNRYTSLFSHDTIKPFNSHEIFSLFADKQKTYNILNKFAIPTVTLKNNTKESINDAVQKLQKMVDEHPEKNDFSKKIVLKDRFGYGGGNIYLTKLAQRKEHIQNIVKDKNEISFILQPFTKFEKGYSQSQNAWFTDIRIIYLNARIIESYTRTARKGDFRSNSHREGGNIEYLSKKEIPVKVLKVAEEIMKILDNDSSLFALDFIISNNGNVYLMEGNSSPSLTWHVSDKMDREKAQGLMRKIVRELSARVILHKNK